MSKGRRKDYATRFQPQGVGITHDHKPVSVMLPPELDAYVRSLPNRSEWLRDAIAEKIERDKQQNERSPHPENQSEF